MTASAFALVFAVGAVNWLATLLLVEGFVFDTARALVKRAGNATHARGEVLADCERHPRRALGLVLRDVGGKLAYLPDCHLCMGVWVGLALAALVPGPLRGHSLGLLLDALLYKAVGHTLLQVTALWQFSAARQRADASATRRREQASDTAGAHGDTHHHATPTGTGGTA